MVLLDLDSPEVEVLTHLTLAPSTNERGRSLIQVHWSVGGAEASGIPEKRERSSDWSKWWISEHPALELED